MRQLLSSTLRSATPRSVISAPPETYAEWSACLDRLQSGQDFDQVIAAIEKGTLPWTSGVAEPFAARIHQAFDARLKACSDRFNRDLSHGSDETTIVRAMAEARRMIALLYRVASAPPFPDTLRDHLTRELQRFAENAQQALEKSAAADRQSQGQLLHTVRHHALTRFEKSAPQTTRPRTSDAALGVVGKRRTILS